MRTPEDYARQDMADLNARWLEAVGALRAGWSAKRAARVRAASDAIQEYMRAGEVPRIEGPDALLVSDSTEVGS